ncbi:MAG: DUF1007 family protein, partial [Nitratireductor sp.]|nr:DUF1007 family protein [Nitratireductor sp.]
MKNFLRLAAISTALLSPAAAFAHPHVFVEANLEVVRGDGG